MSEYILKNDALEIVRRTSGDYAAAFSAIRKLPAANVVQVPDCDKNKGSETMERLTERMNDEWHGIWLKDHDYIAAAHRLADYEDTGLAPEEIKRIKDIMEYVGQNYDYNWDFIKNWSTSDRLFELSEADVDGRVIVLPCKIGDTMWKLCTVTSRIKFGDLWDGKVVKSNCDRCAYGSCSCYDIGLREHRGSEMIDIIEPIKINTIEFAVKILPYVHTIWFSTREEAEEALKDKNTQIFSQKEI